MTAPHDPHDSETEAMIRRALRSRADATTVSTDALATIRRGRSRTKRTRPLVYAAAASVLVVLIGAAFFLGTDDEAPVNTVDDPPPTSAETPDGPEPTDAPEPTDGPEPTNGQPDGTDPPEIDGLDASGALEPLPAPPAAYAEAGLVIWPLDDRSFSDGQSAAADWAEEVLGVEDPAFEASTLDVQGDFVDPTLEVHGLLGITEGGAPGRVTTRVVTTSIDGGRTWVVTHALGDEIRVNHVEENTDDTIRVTGEGRAFEATANLIVDEMAPRILWVGSGPELSGFSAVADAPAQDSMVIRVLGAVGLSNGVPDVTSFAAIPAPRTTEIAVFGVAADDVLNVRSGPGVENDIVATLAPDASGVVHTGGVGGDDDQWWEIEVDGTTGWVNRAFLSVQHGEAAIPDMTDRVLAATPDALESLDPAAMAPTIEIGGIGVYADFPTPWTSIARDDLDEVRNWSPADPDDELGEMTAREFLNIDEARWAEAEYTIGVELEDPNLGYPYLTGLTEDFYNRFTTVTAYIPPEDEQQTLDWLRYTVVWETDNAVPRVRGIWIWGWTP